MKRLFLICFMLVSIGILAQTTEYNEVYVKNTYGYSFAKFTFSYDNYNHAQNNFLVESFSNPVSINFKVYLNGVIAYIGWVAIPAWSSYYFDNAFYDYNSSYKSIEITCSNR